MFFCIALTKNEIPIVDILQPRFNLLEKGIVQKIIDGEMDEKNVCFIMGSIASIYTLKIIKAISPFVENYEIKSGYDGYLFDFSRENNWVMNIRAETDFENIGEIAKEISKIIFEWWKKVRSHYYHLVEKERISLAHEFFSFAPGLFIELPLWNDEEYRCYIMPDVKEKVVELEGPANMISMYFDIRKLRSLIELNDENIRKFLKNLSKNRFRKIMRNEEEKNTRALFFFIDKHENFCSIVDTLTEYY